MSSNFGICECIRENHQDNIVAILSLKADEYRDNMLKSRNDAFYMKETGDLETSQSMTNTADTFERMKKSVEDTIITVVELNTCPRDW